ncbi:cytochrome p450 domain-containing protein [Sarocladium implicatum]|nr:cytochrome p450 domain-containing protein [Sarocladium implicatum]
MLSIDEFSSFDSLTAPILLICVTSGWTVFKFLQALYNISPLHPLSNVPGPKLAAATYWPEFYHDVILFGRYTREIERMHMRYGPIVRINPNETHCNDANFVDEIYATGGRKRDKPIHQINGSAVGTKNNLGTVDHDLHRLRRAPVARFFSRAMITRLEEHIHVLTQKLCDKLLTERDTPVKPFDVGMAYSCFTADAISEYCFGEPFGHLAREGTWTPNFREATLAILKPVFLFRFFPFLIHLAPLGRYLVDYLPADEALLVRTIQIDLPARVWQTKADLDAGKRYERPTVFGDLLQSELEGPEKDPARLADEAVAILGGGTETTTWALTVMTFHLLSKPEMLAKLESELRTVVRNAEHLPPWTTLEKLSYLTGVIQEGLRLSYGLSSRTARVPTQEDLIYRGEFEKKPFEMKLARGYAIGMSAAIAHHDERFFPDSHSFIPERWIDEKSEIDRTPEKGMLAFSKGTRGCPGKNLALCELYVALTALTLRVLPHMRLHETTTKDVEYDHDMFVPIPEPGTKGVRVTMQ